MLPGASIFGVPGAMPDRGFVSAIRGAWYVF